MELKFSSNLKMLRIEKGLTQSQLAKKIGTTQRKISYWEAQKVEPDLQSLIDLADFFDVTLDFLVGKTDY